MPLDVLIVSVSKQADGRSLIGYGPVVPGENRFIRLVAPTPSGVVYPDHHQLHVCAEPRPLDLIRLEAPWADSRPTQPENRVLDDTPWQLLERPASRSHFEQLERRELEEGPLFGDTTRAVRAAAALEGGVSIQYVATREAVAVCWWDAKRERYRARIRFECGGLRYDLPLTDLHYSQILLARGEGEYSLEQLGCRSPHGLRLLVTLGEPYHGWCYKMVAGLLPRRTVTLWRDALSTPLLSSVRHTFDDSVEHGRAFVAGA